MKDNGKEKHRNLQETFLNHMRRGKVPVTVFLVNGVRLQGVITSFDRFSILLQRDTQSQLVFKHVISTVMPGVPLSLEDLDDGPARTAEPEEFTDGPAVEHGSRRP